jgi:hypothetical protein
VLEHPENIRTELDAGADFAELCSLLKDGHFVTVSRKYERRSDTANAAAGN